MASTVTVRSLAGKRFTQQIETGDHRLLADEPAQVGGSDLGPGPYEYLLAALGSCTSMTLQMYARRKGWKLERVEVKLQHSRIHAADCEDCDTTEGMVLEIQSRVRLRGDLDAAQRERLLEIAPRASRPRRSYALFFSRRPVSVSSPRGWSSLATRAVQPV
jgi:putative redox protein